METYSYKGVSAEGKNTKGTVEAESPKHAVAQLKAQGIIPIDVEKQSVMNKEIELPGLKRKVKTRDLCVFCRQFSSIIKSGVSVIEALGMLGDQTESKVLKPAILDVQVRVEKGETLSNAMKEQGDHVFPKLLVSMVSAGEASGSLETVFDRMAIQFEKDNKIKGMVKKAMIYPIVLIFVAIIIVIIMMTTVIPNFVGMFEDMDAELPFFTKLVMSMSNFIVNDWYILIGVVAAVVVGYRAYVSTYNGKHVVARIKLHIPVFGKLVQKTACSRFTRILSTLTSAGMSMMDALEIAAGTMGNVIYEDAVMKVRNGVGLGMQLSSQLENTGLFPAMVVHMTGIGEETGNLEDMLTSVANYYDEEVELASQQVTALMEPMIILVMAVVVGGIVMAIYGPMISLYDTLGS